MGYSRIAKLYDIYVNTNFDFSFFIKEAKNASRVLELMSGTGRLSIPLIEAGMDLTCVDNSPDMLACLQEKLTRKGLSANVHEMDVCDLSLKEQFDLIIIPFHAFAEILNRQDQTKALKGIRRLLTKTGRFICILHNPPVRLRSVTGSMDQLGKYHLPDDQGTLFLSAIQRYDKDNHIINGTQFFEIYGTDGAMIEKSFLDIHFYLHEKEAFQEFVQSEGFRVLNLYGDYSHGTFEKDKSPFMIWFLQDKNALNNRSSI